MNNLSVGIDLDEVVFEFVKPFIEFYSHKTGNIIPYESISSFNLWERGVGNTREETIKLVDEFSRRYLHALPLIPGVQDALKTISTRRRIFFVTSRPEKFKDVTSDSLKNSFPFLSFDLI